MSNIIVMIRGTK